MGARLDQSQPSLQRSRGTLCPGRTGTSGPLPAQSLRMQVPLAKDGQVGLDAPQRQDCKGIGGVHATHAGHGTFFSNPSVQALV